jgi:chromate transporter
VVAVMAWALIDLGRRIIRGPLALLVGLVVTIAGLYGANPILLLLVGGLLLMLPVLPRLTPSAKGLATFMTAASAAINTSLVGILLAFLKYGAVSFGSGYVLFAFLHADVVDAFHWLTTQQLLDAIALSQATPGPVFTVATFIGFLVAGVAGALVATIGIFLPGFVLVPFLERIVRLVNDRPWARAFLEGVNIAALGLIGAVAIQLGRSALVDPPTVAIAVISLALLIRWPLAAPALVIAGGALGLLGFR